MRDLSDLSHLCFVYTFALEGYDPLSYVDFQYCTNSQAQHKIFYIQVLNNIQSYATVAALSYARSVLFGEKIKLK